MNSYPWLASGSTAKGGGTCQLHFCKNGNWVMNKCFPASATIIVSDKFSIGFNVTSAAAPPHGAASSNLSTVLAALLVSLAAALYIVYL